MVPGIVLRDAEVAGRFVSVRTAGGRVAAIGPDVRATAGDVTVDAGGGALLRGLHDHHVHVHALAAALDSVTVGPPAVTNPATFARALQRAARDGRPVRAVGYFERVAGDLDRHALDAIVADVAVRVQHRTGGLWVLNTAALEAAGLLDDARAVDSARAGDPRVERDAAGRVTGRLWRADDLVRDTATAPDLAPVGAALARFGVTALTDATATNDRAAAERLAGLPQRVRVMGPLDLTVDRSDTRVQLGEVKILLDDDRLPAFDDTVALVRAVHDRDRGAAFHCVTLVQLEFALSVLHASGARHDRIEHASIAPADSIARMRDLGIAVATQPSFVAERGDDYLRDVDPRDLDALYPVASLLRAGVTTFGSSDAPYTTCDPWAAMRAAVHRRTPAGAVVGGHERITPAAALGLFGAERPIVDGAPADLVVLRVPRDVALERLDASDVGLTMVGGDVVWDGR